MRILFIAPASNLKSSDEIIRAATEQTVTICAGEVDRAKAEVFLREEYDAIHFIGHGDLSVLQWSDGLIEVSELVDMMRGQRRLRFVVITACMSARVGAELHNAFHVPVVMCQAEITDPGALRFSEVFYRSLRTGNDIHRAVASGRAALAQVSVSDADVVTLINGDMATVDSLAGLRNELDEVFERLDRRLDTTDMVLTELDQTVKKLTHAPDRTTLIIIALLAILALEGLPALLASAAR